FAGEKLPALQSDYISQVLNDYIREFSDALQTKVADLKASISQNLGDSEGKLASSEKARERLEGIRDAAEQFSRQITELQIRYGVQTVEQEAEDESLEEEDAWLSGNGNGA